MLYVVIIQRKDTGKIICVDGPFDGIEAAFDYKALPSNQVSEEKYSVTVEVLTKNH